jgi:hypothetical protein
MCLSFKSLLFVKDNRFSPQATQLAILHGETGDMDAAFLNLERAVAGHDLIIHLRIRSAQAFVQLIV